MLYEPVSTGRSKYGNVKTPCNNGHMHDSAIEARYCNELALRVRARDIRSYRTQQKYPLLVGDTKVCDHIVDFIVEMNDGTKEVHEVKGKTTKDWVIKKKLFEALYPTMKYIVIRKARN